MKITVAGEANLLRKSKTVYFHFLADDYPIVENFFTYKESKEGKEGKVILPEITFKLPGNKRTYKQNNTLWQLITIIFISQNNRKPREYEKRDLYLDIVDKYAERKKNRFTGELRPVHISESDTFQAALLINGCIEILAEYCDLSCDLQVDVKNLIAEWQEWRGKQEKDPLDYLGYAKGLAITEKIWRERHKVSEASGKGGHIEKAHIVSRGSSGIEEPWNWLALTPEEHRLQHQIGWEEFLKYFPWLKGKVERARELAGKHKL